MKINVALFITALSTTSASAAAGDDGAAAATAATVDRPHLRALLQTNKLRACPAFLDSGINSIVSNIASVSCDDTPNYCDPCGNDSSTVQFSNCYQDTFYDDHDVAYFVKGCCTSPNPNNMNNCNGQNEVEDFIKANDVEKEEEAPQVATTDKLGAPSSTLRASSLLKDNVFAKEGAEDFLEVAGCPAAGWNAEACPADYCADCNGKTHCKSRFIPCPQDSFICVPERNYLLCCNANGNNCNGEFPDQEDAVMIKEVPQDTDKLDASSPLRASLLKVE